MRLDKFSALGYNVLNFIGQFVTILSVNKTRELMGAVRSFFIGMGADCAHFSLPGGNPMNQKVRHMTHAAIIAALYAVLTHMQNILLPNSASMAVQFRVSEALCVLAFFTPAAIPGLTIGCLVFNLTYAAALPLDWVVGSLASFSAAWIMWRIRKVTVKGYPLWGLLMPAVTNAILVGWELTVYIGQAFTLNALYVAIGEAAVLLTLGSALYYAMKARKLDTRLFG